MSNEHISFLWNPATQKCVPVDGADDLACPNLLGICALLRYLFISLNICHGDSKFQKRDLKPTKTPKRERERERKGEGKRERGRGGLPSFVFSKLPERGKLWLLLFPSHPSPFFYSQYFKYLNNFGFIVIQEFLIRIS